MTITHRTLLQWSDARGNTIGGSVAKSANGEDNRILALAAETPDQEFDLDFAFAKLKSCFLLATQDIKIETNADDATGGNTINLIANVPFWWAEGSGVACPFTANVTKIFVTVAGAATAQLDIRILYDATA